MVIDATDGHITIRGPLDEMVRVMRHLAWMRQAVGTDDPARVRQIQMIVALAYGATVDQMLARDRTARTAEMRGLAALFAREFTTLSWDGLAPIFRRDHASLINAVRVQRGLIETDPLYAKRADQIRRAIITEFE